MVLAAEKGGAKGQRSLTTTLGTAPRPRHCELSLQESTCLVYLTGSGAWASGGRKGHDCPLPRALSKAWRCHKGPAVSPGIRVIGRPAIMEAAAMACPVCDTW